MNRQNAVLSAVGLFALISVQVHSADAAAEGPKFWKDIPERAEVLNATFLGGKGNEWLVAGGFQPDGAVVVVGNVLGPVFELSVPTSVIGTDLPPPPATKRVPKMSGGKDSKQETDKKTGEPIWEKPSWKHEGTTGFVARLSSDLKTILSVTRLPWGSGALTSAAIGKDGSIYIAGRASDSISSIGGNVEELKVEVDATRKGGGCEHTFVAKLSSDGKKADWLRHMRGFSDAPRVTLTESGALNFAAQDLRVLDTKGKLQQTISVPGGMNEKTSVSPLDGSIVKGGEHHWPTGREPYRCPTLNIHKPDGSLNYQFYDWGGPYIGLDNLRLESDSAVRAVTHDKDGNIFIYAWSDGGNSVMNFEPNDVRKQTTPRGLGLTTAGAGVLSCAYLIKLEPKEYKAIGWTLWLAFNHNKPNSVWIGALGYAGDGSVCFGGVSANGLWQTTNKLTDAPAAGNYITVLTPDMGGVRFCSVIPGAGATEIGNDGRQNWGIASGVVNGKQRALFVSGAVADEENYGVKTKTPVKNALQSDFGGGMSDGYIVLLDLSTGAPEISKPAAAPAATVPGPKPTAASFEIGAITKVGKSKGTPLVPADGTTFHVNPNVPKWVTVDAEFRDRDGNYWPTFMSGKPVSGELLFKAGQLEPTFTVACSTVCQPRGDQSRRILGEFVKGEQPPKFEFTLNSLGPAKTHTVTSVDRKGNPQSRTFTYYEGQGTLVLGDRKLPVTPRVTLTYHGPKEGGVDTVNLNAWITLPGKELGLTAPGTAGDIDIRIGMSGTVNTENPPKKKK
ncbi:MAG: hypothetical protein WCT04_00855 [Planctomycetota bacterium]